jgi:hypothetical protein
MSATTVASRTERGELHGLAVEIAGFCPEESPMSEELNYADQPTGPSGRVMSVEHGLADMLHGMAPIERTR